MCFVVRTTELTPECRVHHQSFTSFDRVIRDLTCFEGLITIPNLINLLPRFAWNSASRLHMVVGVRFLSDCFREICKKHREWLLVVTMSLLMISWICVERSRQSSRSERIIYHQNSPDFKTK
jgi:hypothetical protein